MIVSVLSQFKTEIGEWFGISRLQDFGVSCGKQQCEHHRPNADEAIEKYLTDRLL